MQEWKYREGVFSVQPWTARPTFAAPVLAVGMAIRRAKKKANVVNDKRNKTCLQRYDTNGYTRLQFLQAVSHNISSYTDDV